MKKFKIFEKIFSGLSNTNLNISGKSLKFGVCHVGKYSSVLYLSNEPDIYTKCNLWHVVQCMKM